MVTARLVGFAAEEAIRLTAFLAQRGVYAEPEERAPNGGEVDLVLVFGTARAAVAEALATWAGRAPAYAVVFVYGIDDMPLDGSSLFPPWVELCTRAGLEEYLEEHFAVQGDPPPCAVPRTVGYTQEAGGGGIARVEVLGPLGVIFETADRVRRADDMTFFIPLGRRRSLAVRGTVISRRTRLRGRSRCVASFMAVPGSQRRALGCLLAGW